MDMSKMAQYAQAQANIDNGGTPPAPPQSKAAPVQQNTPQKPLAQVPVKVDDDEYAPLPEDEQTEMIPVKSESVPIQKQNKQSEDMRHRSGFAEQNQRPSVTETEMYQRKHDVCAVAPKAVQDAPQQRATCDTVSHPTTTTKAPPPPAPTKPKVAPEIAPKPPVAEEIPLPVEMKVGDLDEYISVIFADSSELIEINRLVERPNNIFAEMSPETFEELKTSISKKGVKEPLLVRSVMNGEYEIISGRYRLRAANELGWTKVPCKVADNSNLTDKIISELEVLCNLHRRDNFSAAEMMNCVNQLMECYKGDEKIALAKTAELCGISEEQIGRYMKMGKLTAEWLDALNNDRVPFAAAAILAELDEDIQHKAYEVVTQHKTQLTKALVEKLLAEKSSLDSVRIEEILTANEKVSIKISKGIITDYLSGKSETEISHIIEQAIKQYYGGQNG